MYSNRRASVKHALSSSEPFGTIHSNGSDHVLTQVLSHLDHQTDRVVLNLKSRQDWRQSLVKSDIDDGSTNLADLTDHTGTSGLISDLPTLSDILGWWRWSGDEAAVEVAYSATPKSGELVMEKP